MTTLVGQGDTFGALLRRYRQGASLSQEQLAERARLSVEAVSTLERGRRTAPRLDTVTLLAKALGLSAEERTAFVTAARPRPIPVRSVMNGPVDSAQRIRSSDAFLPPFVGRSRERALLERHLAGEGPPVVVLAGEPGMGKSRLLAEAAAHGYAQGWTVLAGGCQRRGGQEPFAPLLSAIKRCIAERPPARLHADLQGCAWLVRLLPELAGGPIEPLPTWQLSPEQERRLMFGAVERFLTNVAGSAGTLLVLDDLQWAGPDAVDLLAALVGSARDGPLRVIGAYRDTELQPGTLLAALLADLATAALVTHCMVQSLSAVEMEQLLDQLLEPGNAIGADLRARLPRLVGGVPFFLVSYVQGLRAGTLDPESGVPWTLAQSLRQRVVALSETGQKIMSAAAVLGRVAARSVLQGVVAQPEGEVVAALEAVCRARLLEEEGSGAYRFAHDIIREVIEADLSAARRVSLHRRAAEALEAQPADGRIEVLAYHCEQGEAWEKALAYLAQAGDRASAACAGQAAVDYYARAYAASTRLGDAALPSALEVARKRGFIHLDMGDANAAMLAFAQMGEAAQRLDDWRQYEMAVAYHGQAAAETHRFREAERALRVALAVAEEGYEDVAFAANVWLDGNLITRNHYLAEATLPMQTALALGWIYGELQDHERAIELNTHGLYEVLERKAQDPEVEHNTRLNLADSLMALGRLEEAEQQLQIVEQVARQPQAHHQYMLCRNSQHFFHSYGELWLARGDCERAINYAGECLALAESSDSKKNIVNARRLRGQVLLAQGKLGEAAKEIEAALTFARQIANPPQLWRTLAVFGDVLHAQGRGEEARQAYRESLRIIDSVAAALDEPSLCATFLASEFVNRIRQQAGHGGCPPWPLG